MKNILLIGVGGTGSEAVDVLYMTNKPLDMVYYDEPYSHESDDSNSAICLPKNSYDMKDFPHTNSKTKKTLYQKVFVEDEETGATIKRIIYPAGCMIPWHTHTCNHGLYVLKGKSVIENESQEGLNYTAKIKTSIIKYLLMEECH